MYLNEFQTKNLQFKNVYLREKGYLCICSIIEYISQGICYRNFEYQYLRNLDINLAYFASMPNLLAAAIVPNLLEALQDPTKRTTSSLTKLLETKFVHFIDAPSLALIMPVVQRAFQD